MHIIDNMARAISSRVGSGLFTGHRWDDVRVSADVVQDGAIQGGPAPVRKKGMVNSTRGSSYSGLTVLNFKNYTTPFWQSCNFTSQMPHAWKFGSPLEPHLHFSLAPSDPIPDSKNLFNPIWLQGGRISPSTGADIGGGSGYYRSSEYIAVQPLLNYSISYTGTQTSAPVMFWYNAAQVFISSSTGITNISPLNAVYARFMVQDTTGAPTLLQFEQSNAPTAYVPYEVDIATPQMEVGQKLLLEFEYAWINIGEPMGDTTIITTNYTITQEDIDGRHAVVGFGQMEKPSGVLSSMIWGRFSRIRKDDTWDYPVIGGETTLANDTCQGDLYFLEWDYHYQIDKTGTKFSTSN